MVILKMKAVEVFYKFKMQYIANRISLSEDLCNGKPTIRGQRISVQTILEFLGAGESKEEILKQYPSLEIEDIYACIQFSVDLLKNNFQIKQ